MELYLLGTVINNAVSEPKLLKKLLGRPAVSVQATGMIAIPKKRRREEHG